MLIPEGYKYLSNWSFRFWLSFLHFIHYYSVFGTIVLKNLTEFLLINIILRKYQSVQEKRQRNNSAFPIKGSALLKTEFLFSLCYMS